MSRQSEADEPKPVILNVSQLEALRDDMFVTEASTLQWPPGFWPHKFVVKPFLGNGRPFFQSYSDSGSVLYRQADGDMLIEVFND